MDLFAVGLRAPVHYGTAAERRYRACCLAREANMTDTTIRDTELKRMLIERRQAMRDEVQDRIRNGRAGRHKEVSDDLEYSDADVQGDIECALLQMTAETVARIDQALVRLDAGKYGSCFECAGEISERRLRALPFAVRCQDCEERRERHQGHEKQIAQRRGFSLFSDATGF
jgi:DnaK suppressor protein